MSGAPRIRSMNLADSEARPVLGPAGNNARPVVPPRKPVRKVEKPEAEAETVEEEKRKKEGAAAAAANPTSPAAPRAPAVLRRQEFLLHSNLSLNASCSSDASTDSFCSRASTGRIGRPRLTGRRRHSIPKVDKIGAKLERFASDGTLMPLPELLQGKRRCSWVTPTTDPWYVAFHDEEWGVPVHDDRKLFELLVLSGALAELTWPIILSKRHIFREAFMDFDPVLVSKLNEKKLIAPGSTASSVLSEPKLRAIIENARQILKIIEEFGSFDHYCWSFVNHKPILNRFRYPRQVPAKTPKADVISKDLVRRGFRSVSQTIIYSFMQVSGMTNDHLISCYRFEECAAAAIAAQAEGAAATDEKCVVKANQKIDERSITSVAEGIGLELSSAVDVLSIA